MQNTQSFAARNLQGEDQRWQPPPTAAATCRDLTWDIRGGWQDCGGWKRIGIGEANDADATTSNPFSGLGEILSLHWFAQHNGARQWLVFESETAGRLYAFNGSILRNGNPGDILTFAYDSDDAGTGLDQATGRYTPTGPSARTQSVAWGDRLYLVNGYDQPLVFDGTKVEMAGFDAAPAAPSVMYLPDNRSNYFDVGSYSGNNVFITIDGMGLGTLAELESGTLGSPSWETDPSVFTPRKCAHKYAVTFLNERGQESPLSASSNMVVFENGDTGRNFAMVEIPIGGDNVVARRIYRTRNMMDSSGNLTNLGYGEQFYFHSEIQDNICNSIEDGVPDSDLGDLVDDLDLGQWPAGAKYIAAFKNTLFLAGQTANELRYSAPGYPEVFPPDNVFRIGDASSGDFAGMYATKNALVVFKRYGIYLVKMEANGNFTAQTFTEDVGCAAPNSIKELPGLGIVFLSDNGVYLLEGALENTGTPTRLIHLSVPIPDHLERLNRSALLNACGEVYARDREYWLAIPTLGTTDNDRVLVYHYEIGQWSYRDDFPIACMRVTRDHRGHLLFGSNDTAAANVGIHTYSRGFVNKNGTAIAPLYETVHLDFGSVYHAIQPVHIHAYAVGYGNNDLQVNYRVNRERDRRESADKAADQQDPNDTYPVYNTAVWDTSIWSVHRPVVVRFDICGQPKGPVRELQVVFEPASRRFELVGYDIEVVAGLQRKVTPLTTALAGPGR